MSAKVIISEQDRSVIVPSLNGVYAGIVIVSDKGPVNTPVLVTSTNQLLDLYGTPNPRLGVSMYSALTYLSQGNKLWVTRATHNDSKYAAALIRSKILPIPTEKTGTITADHLIVNPLLSGLTQEELNQYQFPVYMTNKEYEAVDNTIFEASTQLQRVRVNNATGISVGDNLSFSDTTLEELNDNQDSVGEDTLTVKVTGIITSVLEFDNGIMAEPVTVVAGTAIRKVDPDTQEVSTYPGNPVVVRDATNSTNILISDADYIAHGDKLDIGGVQVIMNEKNLYKEDATYLELDNLVSVTTTDSIFRVIQNEFEDRDAFLVTAYNQGDWGKNLSIGITPSKNYTSAFNILVYFKGVLVETWEVSRKHELDGFGRQMYLEQKINGKSAYIMVHDNEANVDADGNPTMPLNTDYSLWRKNPEDVFIDSGNNLVENLLKGHVEVKLSSVTNLTLGTRVKFVVGDDLKLSKEYKILSFDSVNNTAILDRKIEEDQISKQWTDKTGSKITTKMFYFKSDNNDSAEGIVNGVRYYAIKVINNVYYNYKLNSSFIISGEAGTLLSPGANMPDGGTNGSSVTIGDLITALNKMDNKEKTPINLFMDGGFATPAYAQAISAIAQKHGLMHGYLSTDLSSEEGVNYLTDIVAYKNSTQLNTHLCSMFSGWIKIYDSYNQLEVWVSPESFAAAAQSFTTRNYNMFTPAAGWTRGKITGGLDVRVKFSEGDRDFLVDNRINPIRSKDGSGLVIWGNETLLVKPSPMQLRSVAMLLIVIKTGLEGMLEYKTFDLNNENTWSIVEGSLDAFMRDEIKAKGGVYNYVVAIKDIITPSDLDNRRMPVFLGIQPTMDIQEIPVTLAIFNNTVDIQVSV